MTTVDWIAAGSDPIGDIGRAITREARDHDRGVVRIELSQRAAGALGTNAVIASMLPSRSAFADGPAVLRHVFGCAVEVHRGAGVEVRLVFRGVVHPTVEPEFVTVEMKVTP